MFCPLYPKHDLFLHRFVLVLHECNSNMILNTAPLIIKPCILTLFFLVVAAAALIFQYTSRSHAIPHRFRTSLEV